MCQVLCQAMQLKNEKSFSGKPYSGETADDYTITGICTKSRGSIEERELVQMVHRGASWSEHFCLRSQ